MKDYKALTDSDKQELCALLQVEIDAGRWLPAPSPLG
jgi:hypothetical protein